MIPTTVLMDVCIIFIHMAPVQIADVSITAQVSRRGTGW